MTIMKRVYDRMDYIVKVLKHPVHEHSVLEQPVLSIRASVPGASIHL